MQQIPFVGASMRLGAQWVWRGMLDGVSAQGYDDLTPSHVGVFRYPGPNGCRPTEVASNLNITKQSVNDLLGDLERKGYLTREPDARDRRARVVVLTARGQRLQRLLMQLAKDGEDRIAALLGPKRFRELAGALDVLTRELTQTPSSAGTRPARTAATNAS
jgi:DNA-binding MarR family transcriptional regulator